MEGGTARSGSGKQGFSTHEDSTAEERLAALMEEFRRRQRERPDLAVRPWWTAEEGEASPRRITGFVVEYCPRGVDSAEVAVRAGRARVEGPRGVREVRLDLARGFRLDGEELECPELVANHLLSMADRTLDDEAA